jgi:hypothetical protein
MPASETTPELQPVEFRQELAGRLRNIGKLKHWWMAVAEAVNNAFDSIHDSGRPGSVEVRIEREDDLLAKAGVEGPVRSIVVADDGNGFHETNFTSFSTPDSLHKLNRGGKGLGRLMCLQAFEQVHVSSRYRDGNDWKHRRIRLQCDEPCLSAANETSSVESFVTEVQLVRLRSSYDQMSGASLDKITEWLAEHFLPVLLERPSWLTSLVIRDGHKTRDLVSHVSSSSAWAESFTIKDQTFRAVYYTLNEHSSSDKIRLVAAGRVVQANTRELEHFVPHLATISEDKAHVILVHSAFFDENVNDARNGVSFSDEGDDGVMGITAAQFRDALGDKLRIRMAARIASSSAKMKARVDEVVSKEAPYYRPLLLGYWESKEFSNLKHNASSEEILTSLDAFKRRDADGLRKTSRRLARLQADASDYWETARQLSDGIEAHKKTVLAEYVALRKILLDRLERVIGQKTEGGRHRESDVHNLIFPQRTDTESNPGVDHQLWILDERLESHRYLASDKPMDGRKGDRPDLLIALDRPGAFVSDPGSSSSGYDRIVLVEFKRGMEKLEKVPTDELPHRQMMRYAHQISEEKALHLGGNKRPIRMAPHGRFYLYAVCDLSKALLERLKRDEGFIPSPTGDGAFAVKNEGLYYLEYISLEKLLEDAKARNSAFFQRLGIDG